MFALALLLAVAGAPDDLAKARAHFEVAERHYQIGRFEEAIGEYTAAYDASPHPALLFNIAQCHRNLGRPGRAIYFLQQYLERAPDAADRPAVEDLIERLEDERLRATPLPPPPAPLATVTPTGPPPLYERWWFWTIVGVAVVAAAGGTAIAVSSRDNVPPGLGDPIRVPPP